MATLSLTQTVNISSDSLTWRSNIKGPSIFSLEIVHPGSALALVRAIVEAIYKGTWAIAYATEDDAEKMNQDVFDWPGMGAIVVKADAAYETGGFFETAKEEQLVSPQ